MNSSIKSVADLVPIFEKFVSDAQQELEDLQNQIAVKKHELAELDKEYENKKIANRIVTDLPREIQREVINWMLPKMTKYYLVYERKLPKNRTGYCFYSSILVDRGATHRYTLTERDSYDVFRNSLQEIYNKWNKNPDFIGQLTDYRLNFTFDADKCSIDSYSNNATTVPRSIGFNIIKAHLILKDYDEYGLIGVDAKENTFTRTYEADSCVTCDGLPNTQYTVYIRL